MSEKALQLCEDRSVLLSSNVANASTPHYKARDIDFHKLMQQADSQMSGMIQTDPNHINTSNLANNETIMYRTPTQKNIDGNTVDPELERKNFLENAINYQVSLSFIQYDSNQIMTAIKGD